MSVPGLDELVEVLPEKDDEGRFFWQSFVERIEERLDGLPAPDGGESFFRECVAAGAGAVPAARRSGLWERRAPPSSDRRARGIYELRIRLGLFFAGSLRYLVHGLPRLRIETGEGEWRPLDGGVKAGAVEWNPVAGRGVSYREFVTGLENGEAALGWSDAEARPGEACLLSIFFLQEEERVLLSLGVTLEVLDYALPGRPRGLFGRMLAADGQGKVEAVDVAGVFLEALGQAVSEKVIRVNTKMGGHLFVTRDFWFLTNPVGLDCVTEFIRTGGIGRRYDLTRHEVFQALREEGYLVGVLEGDDTPRCMLKSRRWRKPLELHGLCIAAGVLFSVHDVPLFEGTVTLMEERVDGDGKR